MSHTCKATLVHCMDFRLEPSIHAFLEAEGLTGQTDIISVAGAAKDIAQIDSGYVEGQVDLSHKLHQTTDIILINHTDCGGYGGREAFADREAEIAQHEGDLKIAKEKLLAKYPELNVRLIFMDINPDDGSISTRELA